MNPASSFHEKARSCILRKVNLAELNTKFGTQYLANQRTATCLVWKTLAPIPGPRRRRPRRVVSAELSVHRPNRPRLRRRRARVSHPVEARIHHHPLLFSLSLSTSAHFQLQSETAGVTKSTEKSGPSLRRRRRRGRCGGGGGLSKSWASFSALSASPSSFPPRRQWTSEYSRTTPAARSGHWILPRYKI